MATYSDQFEDLRSVYLEDSWVLQITAGESHVAFDLDLVLTDDHELFQGVRPGEQYDHRRALLQIGGDQVQASLSGAPPAVDATGEQDHGNIDTWVISADGWSVLTGDWGTARVLNPRVRLVLSDDARP